MAVHNKTAEEEILLDIKVADISWLHRFYLKQEKKFLGALSVIVFLFLWEFIGGTLSVYDPFPFLRINPMFVSAPSLVWQAAIQLFATAEFWNDLRVSGIEFFWGYILSVIVAIPFGILTGWYKRIAYIFDPFINAMNATPRVALLPLVIIWLGIGILSKVGINFFGRRVSADNQYEGRRENHSRQPAHRCEELWGFGVADL